MPTFTISESSSRKLNELSRTSGIGLDALIEQMVEMYRQRSAGLHGDPRFAPPANVGSLPHAEPWATAPAGRITHTPGVCGGRACIHGTRITVWGLAAYKRQGASDAEILRAVQGLTPTDLQAALEYAAAHPDEIDRDIRENEEGEAGLAG